MDTKNLNDPNDPSLTPEERKVAEQRRQAEEARRKADGGRTKSGPKPDPFDEANLMRIPDGVSRPEQDANDSPDLDKR